MDALLADINAIGVGGAFPCPYRKAIHHIRAVAAGRVACVEQFIEQGVVAAVADVERVVTAAPFQLVIAAAAGQSVVKIRAGYPFDIGKCRGQISMTSPGTWRSPSAPTLKSTVCVSSSSVLISHSPARCACPRLVQPKASIFVTLRP